MTVATEACYAELLWTGVETSFSPGFSALDTTFVKVSYVDSNGVPQSLISGAQYSVSLGVDNSVTVTPIGASMPSPPRTIMIERNTAAIQSVDFAQLGRYSPAVHTALHDRAMMLSAELKSRVLRLIGPFFTIGNVVDFRPRRIKAADPIDDADLATKVYVLTVTGILNLQSYVAQCAASAASASASALSALGFQTAAQAARDKAQAWSDTAENTPVQGAEYSAYHWSRKAQAYAASVISLFNNPDDGIAGDVESGPIDDGVA